MSISVTRRLQIMMFVAMTGLIVLAISGAVVASRLRGASQYIYANTLPSLEAITSVNEDFMKLRILTLYFIANPDPTKQAGLETKIQEQQGKIRQGLDRYKSEYLSGDKDRELLEMERNYFETYFAETGAILQKVKAGDQTQIWSEVAKATANMGKLSDAIAAHKKFNEDLARDFKLASESSDRIGQYIALTLIVLSIGAVGVIGYRVVGEIRLRLERLSAFMNEVNTNLDFTVRLRVTRMDELGKTGDAFNKLVEKLQNSLTSIAAGAQSVAGSAALVAKTSGQTAAAASQQSEAASSMAATVEQMTVSINHVADRAHETSSLVSESGRLASSGEEVIGQVTGEIEEIAGTVNDAEQKIRDLEQSSQQIANVVQVIKEVADQTNLLALNAAIEAARAGEQGRGFAVVADEVRKLAERTSASTQQISGTVDTMRDSAADAVMSMQNVVNKVRTGVEHAQQANAAILQIGSSSREAVRMVGDIAEAIREQGAATNNIAAQVERIAQMAEEGSAAASNSARASGELDTQAGQMQKTIAAYRLASSGRQISALR
ncbi:methyl-accepting chemotaxis protein [Niveibacterium terrae]|uniref:methyl-accepting chemotaxis protein n=1 Tax=Niveibacterium terrae TaxID=3373598 RepID=UPI003A8DBE84